MINIYPIGKREWRYDKPGRLRLFVNGKPTSYVKAIGR